MSRLRILDEQLVAMSDILQQRHAEDAAQQGLLQQQVAHQTGLLDLRYQHEGVLQQLLQHKDSTISKLSADLERAGQMYTEELSQLYTVVELTNARNFPWQRCLEEESMGRSAIAEEAEVQLRWCRWAADGGGGRWEAGRLGWRTPLWQAVWGQGSEMIVSGEREGFGFGAQCHGAQAPLSSGDAGYFAHWMAMDARIPRP